MKTPVQFSKSEKAVLRVDAARQARDTAIEALTAANQALRAATAGFHAAEKEYVTACDVLIVARHEEAANA